MPFICMARNDIPDGTLQVLDLWPNTSLRNQSIDPPGQTRYINRTPRCAIAVSAAGVATGGAGNRAADGQLRGLEAYLLDRIECAVPLALQWDEAALTAAADALQAIVDAGTPLTTVELKAALDPISGGNLGADTSTHNLADILSILSGREYSLPVGTDKLVGGVWDPTQSGAFTEAVLVNDSQMLGGELRPVTAGGDTVNVETKPIRYTVDSDAMQISLQSGSLSRMQDGTVDLFVESIYSAFKPNQPSQPGPKTAAVAGARLVTVYDNDGSLL